MNSSPIIINSIFAQEEATSPAETTHNKVGWIIVYIFFKSLNSVGVKQSCTSTRFDAVDHLPRIVLSCSIELFRNLLQKTHLKLPNLAPRTRHRNMQAVKRPSSIGILLTKSQVVVCNKDVGGLGIKLQIFMQSHTQHHMMWALYMMSHHRSAQIPVLDLVSDDGDTEVFICKSPWGTDISISRSMHGQVDATADDMNDAPFPDHLQTYYR